MNQDGWLSATVVTLQFLLCSGPLLSRLMAFFRRRKQRVVVDEFKQAKNILRLSAVTTAAALLLAALALGLYVFLAVDQKGKNVVTYFTANTTVTGGCTFAVFEMDKRWGYWDVQYKLGSRAVLGALAVS
jgi:hypothetical protein